MSIWDTIGEFFYGLTTDYLTMIRLVGLCALVIGYLFGLFQSAFFISKAKRIDIYSKGSGNPGATNMYRVMGAGAGLLTFVLDVAKVVAAIFLTRYIFLTWLQMPIDPIALTLYTGLGAVLGHNFPVYLRGRGGKGVAATCAVYVMLGEWKYIVIGLFVFLLIFLITKYVSLSSMTTIIVLMFSFLFFSLMNWTFVDPDWLIDCQIIVILLAVLVLITHNKNIIRLLYAEEPRFRFRQPREEELSDEYGVEYYYEDDYAGEAAADVPARAVAEVNEEENSEAVEAVLLAGLDSDEADEDALFDDYAADEPNAEESEEIDTAVDEIAAFVSGEETSEEEPEEVAEVETEEAVEEEAEEVAEVESEETAEEEPEDMLEEESEDTAETELKDMAETEPEDTEEAEPEKILWPEDEDN